MQKWEYLAVFGVNANGETLYPRIIQFTESGLIVTNIDKVHGEKEKDTTAKKIAQLGNEGWELVAAGGSFYFKRPKP